MSPPGARARPGYRSSARRASRGPRPAPNLRFRFDVIRPYAHLAWTRIHALAARHARDVEPVPVLFAALLDTNGQLGPAEIPARRRYGFVDVLRTASHLGLSLSPPPAHPFNPLLALRVAGLPSLSDTDRITAVDALFDAVWAGGPGVTDPDGVAGARCARGLDGPALVAAAATPEARDRLRETTEGALRDGIFGVPTVLVGAEMFSGHDSRDTLDRYLAHGRTWDAALAARWEALAPRSVRPASRR